jgi:hypothetical protein
MILKNPGSKIFLTNLLADFILFKIPKNEHSIIRVIDCGNFYLIKAKTTHKEPLEISELITEFSEKFSEFLGDKKITSTIDLIEYDGHMLEQSSLKMTLFNTVNCSYHQNQIIQFEKEPSSYNYNGEVVEMDDNELAHISEFPHGYSLNQGRLLYYYGKNLRYNDNSVDPITYDVLKDKNDMSELKTEMEKLDWFVELTNPLEEFEVLKQKRESI